MTYALMPSVRLLRDTPEHIDFHITKGDYVAYLATTIGMLEEALARNGKSRELSFAKELRKDLRYVHANYRFEKKAQADQIRSGNLLP